MTLKHELLLAWLAATNLLAFLLFAWDKLQAGRENGRRIPELHLALSGAVGGWPGGFLGMLIFRHKTAKLSFQVKWGIAFLIWAGLLWCIG